MGQIVIEAPIKGSIFYKVSGKKAVTAVLANLEKEADRLGDPSRETEELLDDIDDIIAAREALAEEGSISFEELKKELGL